MKGRAVGLCETAKFAARFGHEMNPSSKGSDNEEHRQRDQSDGQIDYAYL